MQVSTVSTQPHHLPQQFTSFVGREQELADLSARLADPACRLLTLVGPGGIGKTRLAIRATTAATAHFSDGTYFINLQPVYEADVLIATIAEAIGFSLSGQDEPMTQLIHFLDGKQILLTLDNFEQLQAHAELLSALLQETAVSLLITSREPLHLQEEWLFPVQGLPMSDDHSAAAQLFADRAQRVQPHFQLSNERSHVLDICRLVEGMPLAIELAAAWARSLTCAEIVTEIQRSLDFLSAHARNVPERHRSIQTIFAQTWQQLSAEEQSVFRQLSVFRGGFRREAATAVAGASLPILSDLIDKSLLRWESTEQDSSIYGRYQIHELLRQFAAEKLAEKENEAAATSQKHTEYYTRFLSERLEALLGNRQQEAMTEIEVDLENIRLTWHQLVDTTNIKGLKQTVIPLLSFYWYRSRFLEGLNLFSQAFKALEKLPQSIERDEVIAMLQNNLATIVMMLGDLDTSTELAAASLELYERHQLPPPLGLDTDPRLTLANNARLRGDFATAVAHAQAALTHNLQYKNQRNIQEAYRMIAEAQIGQQALDEAWQNAEQSFAIADEVKDLGGMAYANETLGSIALAQEKDAVAEHHYQASYAIWQQLKHDAGQADMLQRLGDLALRRQAYAEAADYYQQCLPLFVERHVPGGILGTLVRLAQTAVYQSQYESARQNLLEAIPLALAHPDQYDECVIYLLLDAAQVLLENDAAQQAVSLLAYLADHPQLQPADQAQVQTLREQAQAQMTNEAYETAVALGQDRSLEDHLTTLKNLLAQPLSNQPARSTTPTPDQPLVDPLTPRELEVLQLIADGLSNQEIADDLIISVGTVKYYTSHIYGKLQVSSRTHAVAQARELGILT